MAPDFDFELTKPVPVARETKDDTASEVRDLKKILAAEGAAVETYKKVLRKFPDFKQLNDFKDILQGHKKAVEFWKTQLRSKDIHIKDVPGPWSNVVATLSADESLGSLSLTLQELKLGEVHQLSKYEELVLHNKVNFQSASFIRNICLDQQRKHLAMLEGLMGFA